MNQSLKVSVVIPVYNVAPFLKQCLDSLCNQTMKEIEIICVDDGSTDESLDILREYEKKDSRIRIFENKEEGAGAALARNMGVKQALGDYLMVVDSDDYFSLELAEKTYERAVETEADIVLFDAQEFDSHTGEFLENITFLNYDLLPNKDVFSPKEIADQLFLITNGHAWNKLYRTAFVQENDLKFQPVHVTDDALFTYTSYVLADKITYLRDKFVFYRMNNQGSQVNNPYRDPLSPMKMLTALQSFLIERDLFSMYQNSFFVNVQIFSQSFLRTLHQYEGFKALYEGLQQKYLQQCLFAYEGVPEEIMAWGKEIQDTNFESYLFRNYVSTDVAKYGLHLYPFPKEKVNHGTKMVLYGAGVLGRAYFAQNTLCRYCNIVAWVDQNHQRIGFPVRGLDVLDEVDFDVVVIAIQSKGTCQKVKESLLARGVPEEKIV